MFVLLKEGLEGGGAVVDGCDPPLVERLDGGRHLVNESLQDSRVAALWRFRDERERGRPAQALRDPPRLDDARLVVREKLAERRAHVAEQERRAPASWYERKEGDGHHKPRPSRLEFAQREEQVAQPDTLHWVLPVQRLCQGEPRK